MAFAPLILTITIALVIGIARRGRITSLVGTRLHSVPLLVVAVATALALDHVDLPTPQWWAIGGLAAGLVFTVRNVHLPGMAVIAIGVLLNLVPVIVNGATPVRGAALVEAGMLTEADLGRVALPGARTLADADTSLVWMGDTVPVAAFDQVLSFGDLVVLVGLVSVVVNAMRRRRQRRLPASCLASLESFGWHETDAEFGAVIELRNELRPLYAPDEGEIVRVFATTSASPAHD